MTHHPLLYPQGSAQTFPRWKGRREGGRGKEEEREDWVLVGTRGSIWVSDGTEKVVHLAPTHAGKKRALFST